MEQYIRHNMPKLSNDYFAFLVDGSVRKHDSNSLIGRANVSDDGDMTTFTC